MECNSFQFFQSKLTIAMKNTLKKNALFILVLISTFTLEIIGYYFTTKKFIPSEDPGEYDFIGNYRMVLDFLKILLLFTNVSFAVILATLLIFRNMIELELRRNIYFSLIYLIIAIILILVFM